MIRSMSLERFLKRCRLQGESAQRFLSLHANSPDLAIKLNLNQAFDEWTILKPRYQAVVLAAHHMDSAIRKLEPNSLQVSEHYRHMLYYCYSRAFRAELIYGYSHQERSQPAH
jgi:hypothetical protein